MRVKWKPQSTFQKLCLAFLLLGVLPMILVCLLFMRRYEGNAQATTKGNMEEANYFAQSKVETLIESIDRATEVLYDFSVGPYAALWEVLEDSELNDNEKQMYVGLMLDELLQANPAVSAAYFVTPDGSTYSRFYSQQKSLRTSLTVHHSLPEVDSSRQRQLFVLGMEEEGQWCNGSEDTVLTLARNYMDIRSLNAITTVSLGTLYVDVRTDALDELLSSLRLGEFGNVAIVEGRSAEVLYQLYPDVELPYLQELERGGGSYEDEHYSTFYQPIGDSAYHLMVTFDRQELNSIHSATRTYLFLTLAIAVVLILALSLLFSGRISTPARELKRAMEEVRCGNLNARVNIQSGDEMEYLGDGFNQMVENLSETIQEVYVAQICQRDAELNALKMQIRPHYLYNTLDVIRMGALEQEDIKTARLIESLSRQLRYITGDHQERVALRQELDSLQEYAVLIEARYEGRIKLKLEVADSDLSLYVPKLLLQPFVENAIKHGLRDKPEGGTILIEAVRLPDTLQIMVFNDGIPVDAERLEHIRTFLAHSEIGAQDAAGIVSVGMKNTYDRIKLNCGREYGFTLDSDENMGAVVTIRLPIWKGGRDHVEGTVGG